MYFDDGKPDILHLTLDEYIDEERLALQRLLRKNVEHIRRDATRIVDGILIDNAREDFLMEDNKRECIKRIMHDLEIELIRRDAFKTRISDRPDGYYEVKVMLDLGIITNADKFLKEAEDVIKEITSIEEL